MFGGVPGVLRKNCMSFYRYDIPTMVDSVKVWEEVVFESAFLIANLI